MIVKVSIETEKFAWTVKRDVNLFVNEETEELLGYARKALGDAGMAYIEQHDLSLLSK